MKLHARFGAVFIVVVCTLLTAFARVLWKFGALRWPEILTNWQLFGGFVLFGIAAVTLIHLFKTQEVTLVYPLYATAYVWVALLSHAYFAEPLSLLKWIGIATIIAGAAVLGTATHKHDEVIV